MRVKTSDRNEGVDLQVVTLVESFSTVCHTPPARKEIGAILEF